MIELEQPVTQDLFATNPHKTGLAVQVATHTLFVQSANPVVQLDWHLLVEFSATSPGIEQSK